MAVPLAASGEIIDVGPPDDVVDGSKVTATPLVKTAAVEVIRLAVPAGKVLSSHTAPGNITVHCLAGAVDFTAAGRTQRLTAGRLLYLPVGTLHALHGVEDATVLVTIVRCNRGGAA